MERRELSLKNIYRLLMANDFPVYSESVINAKDRKGQTVLRFWQSFMCEEFRSQPYGKMIWRSGGTRNRYTSHLCNRSEELKYYHEYAGELVSQLKEDVLLKQIQLFIDFLSAREYKYEVFIRRADKLMEMIQTEDYSMTEEIAAHIRRQLVVSEEWKITGPQGRLFHTAWILTVLMLYGAAGKSMLQIWWKFSQNEKLQMETFWELYLQRKKMKKEQVKILTKFAGIIQNSNLSKSCFFGREEELFDLQEMAVKGNKLAITGIGGIGKTELLRQLMVRCVENHLVDQIAVVPYENSLVDSFGKAFPEYQKDDLTANYHIILSKIRKSIRQGEKILILIDNMEKEDEEAVIEELTKLSCSIFVTTRRTNVKGFEKYLISPISIGAGTLIFRDNYGSLQTSEDKKLLYQMLEEERLRHPLTIKMLSRAARCKRWTLGQLRKYLESNEVELSWMEGEQLIKLKNIYSQLYSLAKIPESGKIIAELFSLLPFANYSEEWIGSVFATMFSGLDEMEEQMHFLEEYGWIEKSEAGYHMHPLIAQCLRKKNYTEDNLKKYYFCLSNQLPDHYFYGEKALEQQKKAAEIMLSVSGYMRGRVSRELLYHIMKAMSLFHVSKATACTYKQRLEKWMAKNETTDTMLELKYQTLCGFWNEIDDVKVMSLYQHFKKEETAYKEDFIDFCLYVGGALAIRAKTQVAALLLNDVVHSEADAEKKAIAYYQLTVCSKMSGNYENTYLCAERAYEYMESHPECAKGICYLCRAMMCSSYLEFGKKQEAEPLLKKLKDSLSDTMPALHRSMYEDLAGFYHMNYGNLLTAMEHYENSLHILNEYDGEGYNYFMQIGKTAIVYQRLKKFDKAVDAYQFLLKKVREHNLEYEYFLFSNNMAAVYNDMEQPIKALEHLLDVMSYAREIGGIALGELLRNVACAYRQLKQYNKEFESLKEGSELLVKAYGDEHPKSIAAKERLAELAKTYQI